MREIPTMARKRRLLLFFLSTCRLACALSNAAVFGQSDDDEEVTLRGGVVIEEPYALLADDGGFAGFMPDMIRRLEAFAAEDGIRLNFELELADARAPSGYNGAFDLVANDCNTTAAPAPLHLRRCAGLDVVVGAYYVNPSRSMRADLSPPFLRAAISTIKAIKDDPRSRDFATLSQLEEGGGVVCVQDDTYYAEVVMGKFPRAEYLLCEDYAACWRELKDGGCDLYAGDDLALRYSSVGDGTLKMTGGEIRSQYLVWALRHDLEDRKSMLLKKWMYAAIANGTLDELYSEYFHDKICPLGKSGESCESFCDPEHGRADRSGTCMCNSMKWTGVDCSVEVEEELNLIPKNLKIASYVFVGINLVSCLICAAWLHWKRDAHQVKVLQPFFLRLVLLGCTVSTATIIVLSQESPGSGPVRACTAIPWLYSIGFSLTFGTLFAKIWRVYRLFRAAAEVRRVRVTGTETALQICAITSVDVVICAVWTIADPLRWERRVASQTQLGEPIESYGYCTSDHWRAFAGAIAVWHLLLLLLASSLCYVSRNITTRFAEGKPLAIVMVSNLQILLVSVPVLVLVGIQSASSFFIRVAVIWINDFAVIAIIFGNLMLSVYQNTRTLSVRSAINSFVRKESMRNGGRGTVGNSVGIGVDTGLSTCRSTGVQIMNSTRWRGTGGNSVGTQVGSGLFSCRSTGDQGPETSTIQGDGGGDNDGGHSDSHDASCSDSEFGPSAGDCKLKF